MNTTNITEPLKPTGQTSYGQTFIALLFVGPAFVMGWLWLGRRVLTPDDAETFKSLLVGLWGLLTATFGGATATGGLARTFFKIDRDKAAAAPLGSDAPIADAEDAGGVTDHDNAG